jgi:3-deoxy-7-phosphoheptulonate synthase
MALAGVACGASGLLLEVHPNPDESISDKDQALSPREYMTLVDKVKQLRRVINEH